MLDIPIVLRAPSPVFVRRIAFAVAIALCATAQAVGTWTPMIATPPIQPGSLALLTDGSVIMSDAVQGSPLWYRLKPDGHGSYANGTWQPIASSHVARVAMPSAVLKDGRYLVAGGEIVSGSDYSTVEIYDPIADTWTMGPDMPAPNLIDDTPATILPDGRFFCSAENTSNTYFFDPHTNLWTFSSSIVIGSSQAHERGWLLLQNGTVLDAYLWQRP